MKKPPLAFDIVAECKTTKARVGVLTLPHACVDTPVFMPVGTKGTVKGLLPDQLDALNCKIILGNTYHLGTRPGRRVIKNAGGLHKFMGWKNAMLTDSGGFQMVSLLKLAEITEEGVKFKSPYDENSECMLTPEQSILIQNDLGADIAMQLDDVVSSKMSGPRVEEAMRRTTRWLDRCLKVHAKPDEQNIFPIVQGGLSSELRKISAGLQTQRNVSGFAIGGLSGGEAKDDFWKMVNLSTNLLPKNKPRYLMGVGYAEDMLISCALGIDMFDCVYPTRTARFGNALTLSGPINLKKSKYENDLEPIEKDCDCLTCQRYTKSYLNSIVTFETVGCHLISIHNIAFQMRFTKKIRDSIKNNCFPNFVKTFLDINYPEKNIPEWIIDALLTVNIDLNEVDLLDKRTLGLSY